MNPENDRQNPQLPGQNNCLKLSMYRKKRLTYFSIGTVRVITSRRHRRGISITDDRIGLRGRSGGRRQRRRVVAAHRTRTRRTQKVFGARLPIFGRLNDGVRESTERACAITGHHDSVGLR